MRKFDPVLGVVSGDNIKRRWSIKQAKRSI